MLNWFEKNLVIEEVGWLIYCLFIKFLILELKEILFNLKLLS